LNEPLHKSSDSTNERNAHLIRRVGLGWLATFLGQVINFAGRVVSIPLFLAMWGNEKYGEWLTLYAFVGYLTVMDFGMQPYVVNRLITFYSLKKLDDYKRILHSALSLSVVIALTAMTVLTCLAFTLPLSSWLHLKFSVGFHGLILVLLAGQIVFAIPMGLIRSVYASVGEYPRGMMTANVQQFFLYGLTIFILFAGGGLLSVAAIQLLPLFGITLFILFDLPRRHPEIQIGVKKREWALAFNLFLPSLFFFLIYLSNAILLSGSILVVNAVLGAASVAVFATIRTMCNLIQQFIGLIKTPLWPEINAFEAEKDYEKLRIAHQLLVKVSFWACGSMVVFLHFFGKDIINLWIGGKIIFDQRLLDLFLIYLTSQIIWSSSSLILVATNHHRKFSICQITSSISGLGLAIILASHMGLSGIVLGLFLADIATCLWFVPRESCKLIGESLRKFWTDCVLRGIPILLIVSFIAWWIGSMIESPIFSIVLALLSVGIAVTGMGYFFWLNAAERMRITPVALRAWKTIQRTFSYRSIPFII
jgi:O-antigen/teichoic acid export membrane protein